MSATPFCGPERTTLEDNRGSFAKNLCADRLHTNKPPAIQAFHAVRAVISQNDPNPAFEVELLHTSVPPRLSPDLSGLYHYGITSEEQMDEAALYLAYLHRKAICPAVAIHAIKSFALEAFKGNLVARADSERLHQQIDKLCDKICALQMDNLKKDRKISKYQELKDKDLTTEELINDNAQKAQEIEEKDKKIRVLNSVKGMQSQRMAALEGRLAHAKAQLARLGVQDSDEDGSDEEGSDAEGFDVESDEEEENEEE